MEWSRKAELSSDRAGLLATQDPQASMRLFLKFAGGITADDESNLDEFLTQAQEYEQSGGALDTIFRVLNVAGRTHPFNTVRAAELQRWIETGAYERIVNGDYPRRGENDRPLSDDYAEAAGYYRNEAQSAVDQVKDALRGARDAFNNAYRNATSKVKVLLVGGGAREHALAWKLTHDDPSLELLVAPGNPGIAPHGRCVAIKTTDVAGLVALARDEQPDLTVVGPEAPLAAGLGDAFREHRLPVFGPTAAAARIESSKAFAKALMVDARVPTARAERHVRPEEAKRAARAMGAPVVIKASGLAAGKGVVIAPHVRRSRSGDRPDARRTRVRRRGQRDPGGRVHGGRGGLAVRPHRRHARRADAAGAGSQAAARRRCRAQHRRHGRVRAAVAGHDRPRRRGRCDRIIRPTLARAARRGRAVQRRALRGPHGRARRHVAARRRVQLPVRRSGNTGGPPAARRAAAAPPVRRSVRQWRWTKRRCGGPDATP